MRKLPFVLACLVSLASFPAFGQSDTFQLKKNEAFVIVNNLPLYQEVKSGVLKWKESLVIGDKVAFTGKTWKFIVDGNEREYTRVKAPSGNEGWVRSSYAIQKCQLAAVKADSATVFTEPRQVKLTSKSISSMTIVAALADGSTPEFAKVVCYDPSADAYFTDPVFVSKGDLTFEEVDLNALILFMTANSLKDKAMKAKFFNTIDKTCQSTVFYDKIKAALAPDAVSAKPTAPFSGQFTVNDDKVNVRSQPDETNGQVVGQLNQGAVVEAVEATTKAYTVGGQTALWYRIKSPSGWVFGAFLSDDEGEKGGGD